MELGARLLGNPAFCCAICRREANKDWWSRDGIPPVCRYCETEHTPVPKPFGAFKDRRIARQLIAVAQALEAEANQQLYRWK